MIRDEKMIIPKEKMVHGTKKQNIWAVVVAQLVERSLPTPEVRGLNPVIGKLLYGTFVYWQLY